MKTVAIVYYSADGHTHAVAEHVAEGVRATGSSATLVRLVGTDITAGRWKNDAQVALLNSADAIVFGTPTYMGGYSGQMKAFIDGCGGIWFQQLWKDKHAAAFTHSQGLSGDKLNTLMGLFVNAMQHGMIWIGTGQMVEGMTDADVNRLSSFTGLMAQTPPGQATVPAGDLAFARKFGARIAAIVSKA
jgi:NAD(P)H dehydrogenase (quinone)